MAHKCCTMLAGLCFLVLSTTATATNTAAPWFCHGLDCPKYKVLNATDDFEIRALERGKWATTRVESLLYSIGITEGFEKLFKYISGANEGKQKIDMTAPVVTRVTPGDGPFCKSTFSVHFFVPFKWQEKPPVPSNPAVEIESRLTAERGSSEVFAVSQFGGFLVDDYSLSSKAKKLQQALEEAGIDYVSDYFFTAGYDPPYRLQHRHNEIWVKLASKAQSS